MQAIQSGLTVAAGTGGAAALLLAARRQWLQERDQSHREETDATNQEHQRDLAALAKLDATERRITDLYTKAVDQLGSEKAPVRLGGLYALERLAQDNPDQRQTIVNVICAYLRMPYTLVDLPAEGLDSDSHETKYAIYAKAREELQVRFAAQRILAAHLMSKTLSMRAADIDPASEEPLSTFTKFWDHISIDLTGATLVDFDFHHCAVAGLDCTKTVFVGNANFRYTSCAYGYFGGASFSSNSQNPRQVLTVSFSNTEFAGPAIFDDVEFKGSVTFRDARFNNYASFRNSKFSGAVSFNEATFVQGSRLMPANFEGATFSKSPVLTGATVIWDFTRESRITAQSWPQGWTAERDKERQHNIGNLVYYPLSR